MEAVTAGMFCPSAVFNVVGGINIETVIVAVERDIVQTGFLVIAQETIQSGRKR